jgi:hypothetical protein
MRRLFASPPGVKINKHSTCTITNKETWLLGVSAIDPLFSGPGGVRFSSASVVGP